MAKRSAFLVQILDKIGAPLLAAIESHRGEAADEKGVQDAQTIASLLSRAVEMSVNMSQNMDLKGSEEDADSIRLALAALAGPLISEVYKATGKVPDESDIKRMNKTMEAVLTFSDNFAPSISHIARLKSLEDTAIHADEDQNTIYVLQALLPVLGAVAEFPFGQQETALIQDIYKKLQGDAESMTKHLLGDAEPDQSKARYVELMVLKALGKLYAESHKTQTKTLLQQQQSGAEAQEVTMDAVWQSYDMKVSMLEAVVGASMPGGVAASSGAGSVAPAPAAEPPAEVAPPVQQQEAPAPQQPAPAPQAEPQQQPASPAQAGSGGPMSFFKPPSGEPPQQPTQPNPVAPPTPSEAPPPAPDPAQPPQPAETPPPAPPPEAPPAQPQETPPQQQNADAEGGSPMSFFKPGTKNPDETPQS